MATATETTRQTTKPRLKQLYEERLKAELQGELKLHNSMEVPRLDKVIVAAGLGRAKDDKRLLEVAANTISKITGQKPLDTIARMSIASFKLREGNKVGMKVTLRGDRMYEFTDRLLNLVLPRLRDFRGLNSKAFDKQGNYSIGFVDQSVFPELTFEDTANAHGLQITFVISAHNPQHARLLLEKLGAPFERAPTKANAEESE